MAKVPGFASGRWHIVEIDIRLCSQTLLSSSTAC